MRSTNSTTVSTPNPAIAGLLTEIGRQADWSRRLGKMNRRSYRGAARRLFMFDRRPRFVSGVACGLLFVTNGYFLAAERAAGRDSVQQK
jgi:hypothetical protein